jgi:hypothetical protein
LNLSNSYSKIAVRDHSKAIEKFQRYQLINSIELFLNYKEQNQPQLMGIGASYRKHRFYDLSSRRKWKDYVSKHPMPLAIWVWYEPKTKWGIIIQHSIPQGIKDFIKAVSELGYKPQSWTRPSGTYSLLLKRVN